MSETEFAGKTVTILGLGRYEHGSGLAAVKFFMRKNADLIITDLKSDKDLSEQVERIKDYQKNINYQGEVEWVFGEHRERDFTQTDLLVPNPAVPITSQYIKAAQASNVPIETEMSLFFKRCPAEIIGITGTRGKSTTTALIAHLLKAYPQKVWMGGNIAKASPLDFLDEVKKEDRVILELSNFMLEYLDYKKISPHVAVLLNVLPDHMDRYNSMDEYADVKAAITKHQTENDILIINHANEYTRRICENAKADVVWYDVHEAVKGGYYIDGDHVVEVDTKQELLNVNRVSLRGEHNKQNILAAVACVRQLEQNPEPMQKQAGSFPPLEGRLQFIDEIDGITFINDTTSSTPVAAIAALRALKGRPIVLIAGGSDKGLDFSEVAKEIKQTAKAIVWLPGKGTDRFKQHFSLDDISQSDANDMQEAVKLAKNMAQKGDIILLSPACASFSIYHNEFERGDFFNNAVEKLK